MPLSYLRRAPALALFLYAGLLVWRLSPAVRREEPPARIRAFAKIPRTTLVGRVVSGFNPKRQGDRYWIRAHRIGGVDTVPVRVMAYLSRKDPATKGLRPGDTVALWGRLRLPFWPRTPGGFDEAGFLAVRQAALVMHARRVRRIKRPGGLWRAWGLGERAHRSLRAYLTRRFPREEAGILEGLLVGYAGPMRPALRRAVQDSGVMHLLTPSGAKITLVVAWALLAAMLAGWRPRLRWAAAAVCAGAYLFLVGFEPPYTRAYIMTVIAYAAHLLEREPGAFQGWVLAAWLTLLLWPRAIFSAGFQLTYLAMLGLLLAWPRWRIRSVLPGFLCDAAMISLIVHIALWPTFAGFFGRGSLAGLWVNPLLVPLSGLLALAGFGAWALQGLGWAETVLAAAAGAGATAFIAVCRFASSLPYAAIDLAPPSLGAVFIYYLGAGAVLVLPRLRASLGLALLACLLGAGRWIYLRDAGQRAVFFIMADARGWAAFIKYPGGIGHWLDQGLSPSAGRLAKRALGAGRAARFRALGPFKMGRTRVVWTPQGVVALVGGKEVYCVATGNRIRGRLPCPRSRTVSARFDGVVRLISDGQRITITTQKERYRLRRPLL